MGTEEMRPSDVRVGFELPPVSHLVTRRNILRFGKMVGGFNPVHEDDEVAEEFGFEGMIAHGVMHMNYITQVLCDFAGHPDRVRKLDVSFRSPVYPGDEITARGVIKNIERDGFRTRVTCAVWSENQDKVTVVDGSAEIELATG